MSAHDSRLSQNQIKAPLNDPTLKHNSKPQSKRKTIPQHPVEIEFWYILPVLRRELAITLKNQNRLKNTQIAHVLGLTRSAITQYLNASRGLLQLDTGQILFLPKWLLHEVQLTGDRIATNSEDSTQIRVEIQRLMTLIRNDPKAFLCQICQAFGTAPKDCRICLDIELEIQL